MTTVKYKNKYGEVTLELISKPSRIEGLNLTNITEVISESEVIKLILITEKTKLQIKFIDFNNNAIVLFFIDNEHVSIARVKNINYTYNVDAMKEIEIIMSEESILSQRLWDCDDFVYHDSFVGSCYIVKEKRFT